MNAAGRSPRPHRPNSEPTRPHRPKISAKPSPHPPKLGNVPTLLRFRSFRIVIYVDDHPPAHIHAIGPATRVDFYLNCSQGPVAVRQSFNVRPAEEAALLRFIADNLDTLCEAWEDLHGNATATR